MAVSAAARNAPSSRARTNAERVRKNRLVTTHGHAVAAAGLRVGYDDEDQPRALVPRGLGHLREPLRLAGCALYPVAATDRPGTSGRTPVPGGPRGAGPGAGARNGNDGRGGDGGGGDDADRAVVDRALRDAAFGLVLDLEPVNRLVNASREQTVADVLSGPLDEAGVELLRGLYLEMVATAKTSRDRAVARLEKLLPVDL